MFKVFKTLAGDGFQTLRTGGSYYASRPAGPSNDGQTESSMSLFGCLLFGKEEVIQELQRFVVALKPPDGLPLIRAMLQMH